MPTLDEALELAEGEALEIDCSSPAEARKVRHQMHLVMAQEVRDSKKFYMPEENGYATHRWGDLTIEIDGAKVRILRPKPLNFRRVTLTS